MASIFAPVLYLGIVGGGLVVFSYFYRKRARTIQLEPYFPSHPERDAYVTLLQQTDPPAFDGLLKAALFCRSMTNAKRLLQLREDKVAMQNLLQKGSIGDDLWNSLLQAEKELTAENLDVAHEANSFAPGWGIYILNSAMEMVHNQQTKKLFTEIPAAKAKAQRTYKSSGDAKKTKAKTPLIASTSTESTNGKPTDTPKKEPTQPASTTLASPTTTSPSRSTSPSNSNGSLAPPAAGTDGESVASTSDNEHGSPQTPSKKPKGKKGKKRK